ncbi:hypothetical protein BDW62DRAFT_41260 [Aspergillus aurantiobrunneus]
MGKRASHWGFPSAILVLALLVGLEATVLGRWGRQCVPLWFRMSPCALAAPAARDASNGSGWAQSGGVTVFSSRDCHAVGGNLDSSLIESRFFLLSATEFSGLFPRQTPRSSILVEAPDPGSPRYIGPCSGEPARNLNLL